MEAIRRLLGHVRPHLWAAPVLVALGIVASAAEGIGIGMLIPLIDALMAQGEEQAAAGWFVGVIRQYGADLSPESRITLLVGTIFALVVLKSVVIFAYSALAEWFNGWIVHRLRCALVRQMLEVGYAFLARTEHGRLVNALDRQTWDTTEALNKLAQLVIHACNVAVLGILLLLISWQMTVAVALGVLLVSLLIRAAARRSHRLGDVLVGFYSALSERILELLRGMRVVRLFGREADEQARFDRSSDRVRRHSLQVGLITAAIQPLTEVLYVLLFIAIVFIWHGHVSLSTLLPFLLLLYRLQPHIKALDHRRVQLASLLPAVSEVTGLLETQDKPYVRSGTRSYCGFATTVSCHRVSFTYEGGAARRALADVSCSFAKNHLTAVVGASGAGKSTLISLLCRLYDPDQGEIRVDGVPLPELDLASWRARLAFAGQDLELLGDTVAENIAYGRPGATPAEIVAAAREADAHGFITELPQGYDTPVGERGLRLSAGQRQRIALARALLRRPEILILDEATNALDSLSERAIQHALAQLAGKLTMIVIAHRLSTIRLADLVLVLHQGRLVEQGRPDQLLGANSRFARLWELQADAFAEGRSVRMTAPDHECESAKMAQPVRGGA